MPSNLILASASQIRLELFVNAGVPVVSKPARIDEASIKASLVAENASPRDIADTLAEYKARKVATAHPEAIVIGSDQVLDFKGELFSKPESPEMLVHQLRTLKGQTHILSSAAVIYEDMKPVWRFVGQARMTMRDLSDPFIEDYIAKNWSDIQYCVGGYQLEAKGSRLFSKVVGDYFTVLGIPLIEVLSYLATKGVIER